MAAGRSCVCQVSPTGGWWSGRQSRHGSNKRELTTKVHLAVDAHGFPVGVTVTEGRVADCKEFRNLLDEVDQQPGHVIADQGYDRDELIKDVEERGAEAVIPYKSNRNEATDIR